METKKILGYLSDTYHVAIVEDSGNAFMFYDPGNLLPVDQRFPFLTLVTNDLYDSKSDLSRPDVYRLNINIGQTVFQSLFPGFMRPGTPAYDYTALNSLMPHPVYGNIFWCCILCPAEDTFQQSLKPLFEASYQLAIRFYTNRNN